MPEARRSPASNALAAIAAVLVAGVLVAGAPARAAAAPWTRLLVRSAPGSPLPAGTVPAPGAADPLARIGWRAVDVPASRAGELRAELLEAGAATLVEEPRPLEAATTVPGDPAYPLQWEHRLTGTDGAWDTTVGSSDITIAVIDTGVNGSAELGDRLLPGWNAVTGTTDTGDGFQHGTQTALIAAAAGDNGTGGAGVCWRCRILPVKALGDDGKGTTEHAAAGIVWAVDHGATILSLSLTGATGSAALTDAVSYALRRGVPVVAAAGNGATTAPSYPAAYPGVIAVGGTGADDRRNPDSNHGAWVSVTAPWCGVADPDGRAPFDSLCGTSAATPYVSGAIALRRSTGRFPGESAAATKEAVMASAHRTSDAGASASGRLQTDALVGGWREGTPPDPGTPPTVTGARYTPLPPARILDTRGGHGAPPRRLGPGEALHLRVAGAGGVPGSGASAAVLNVTVTNTSAPSYLSVYPDGVPAPGSSSLNFGAGRTLPNLVTTRLGANGYVVIANAAGYLDVVADVQGWFDAGGPTGTGSRYTALTPARILDSRRGVGIAGALGGARSADLQVTGHGGVPGAGVAAVALNVTATEAAAGTYLTVHPSGSPVPTASNLNVAQGETVPNMVIVPVGPGGRISVFNAVGSVHVIGDLVGWFGASAAARFTPLTPIRALDTRGGHTPAGPVGPDRTVQVQLGGRWGVPAAATGAVLNVTVTGPTAGSYLALWPAGVARPEVSNLNFPPGLTIANMAVVGLSADGRVSIYNAVGNTHVVIDVVGYLLP